jgi:GNAT superfamily N-acetyltransferase
MRGRIPASVLLRIAQESAVPPVLLWKQLSADRDCRQPSIVGAVVVRPADAASAPDRDAISRIAAACAFTAGAGKAERSVSAAIVSELGSRPGRTVQAWLGTVDAVDAPIGLVTLVVAGPAPGRCSIGWLLVQPAARRRGVATALVAHALDAARALGHDRVCVETLGTWTDAVAFWRAMGFTAPG